jgi:hypothetical protein
MLPALRIIPISGVSLAVLSLVLALNTPGALRPRLTPAMTPIGGSLIADDLHPQRRQFLFLAALRRADEVKKLRQLLDLPVRSHDAEGAQTAKPTDVSPAVHVAAVPADRRSEQEDVTQTIAPVSGASISLQVAAIPADRRDEQKQVTETITPASGASIPLQVAAVPADRRSEQEDVTGTIAPASDASIPVGIGESSSSELPVIPHQEQPSAIMMPARRDSSFQRVNVVLPPPRPKITARRSRPKRVHQVRSPQVAATLPDDNQFEPQDSFFRLHNPAQY